MGVNAGRQGTHWLQVGVNEGDKGVVTNNAWFTLYIVHLG